MGRAPLRPTIDSASQRYYDEPIYAEISKARQLALAIHCCYGETAPSYPRLNPCIVDVIGHSRMQLRWMQPDGKGGMVPRR